MGLLVCILLSPEKPLSEYFDAPMCSVSWKRSNFDVSIVKFGLLWKTYDWASLEEASFPKPLPEGRIISFRTWIRGGSSGEDFVLVPPYYHKQALNG